MLPPRSYAVFDMEGEEWEGKYETKPNPFLKQRTKFMDGQFCAVQRTRKGRWRRPKGRNWDTGQETTEGSEGNDPSE